MRKLFFSPLGLRTVWKVLGFLMIFAALAALFIFALKHLHWKPPVVAQESLFAVTVYVAAWICLRLEHRPFASLGFAPAGRFVRELFGGTLLGALLIGTTALLVCGTGGVTLHWSADPPGPAILSYGLLFLAAAALEEGLFRGYAFQRVVGALGATRALLLFSVLFMAAHLGNPNLHGLSAAVALSNIFLAGVLLGICYLRTLRLALPIGVHFGWDWGQALLGFAESGMDTHGVLVPVFHGRPDWLTGGPFGLEASLPSLLVLVASIAALTRIGTGLGGAGPLSAQR